MSRLYQAVIHREALLSMASKETDTAGEYEQCETDKHSGDQINTFDTAENRGSQKGKNMHPTAGKGDRDRDEEVERVKSD